MSEGSPAAPPGRPRSRHRRTGRFHHNTGAAAAAILAVLAGILLVNLVNSPPNPDETQPRTAATAGPTGPSPGDDRSTAPSPSVTEEPTSDIDETPAEDVEPVEPAADPPAASGGGPDGTNRVFAPVVVLNNSRVSGLAESAADRVEAAGFRVERVGNYVSQYNVPVSTVFYDAEDADAARTMLETVRGVERMVPRGETRIIETDTLILVVTRDFPVDDQ